MERRIRELRRTESDENTAPEAPREWLVANGLGGYASATIAGTITRRYHGFLIAALPPPLGRMVVLNDLEVEIEREDGGVMNIHEGRFLGFKQDMGLPSWRYEVDGVVIEKSIVVPSRQNIVHSTFRLIGDGKSVRLRLRPFINFRKIEAHASEPLASGYMLTMQGHRYEVTAGPELPTLRLAVDGCEGHPTFTSDGGSLIEAFYEIEAQRGYDLRSWLWSPGYFVGEVRKDFPLTLIAATEPWHTVLALSPDDALAFEGERRRRLVAMAPAPARIGFAAELVLAADTFVVTPVGRIADGARARAEGDEIRTVIAGYHWFTDWGRDTMIALEGLTLSTGRAIEARWILRTFAHYVRDGLIPNLFPEGQNHGLYHTADATLWLFQALHRYVEHSGDTATLELLLPILKNILRFHLEGTRFGIKVDPSDGLLAQGEEGYQLTWMDAKVGDWVVTPRRGKAVEINALWYNALRLTAGWLRRAEDPDADQIASHADRARASFNRRFWSAAGGYLYDVVDGEDGDDDAFRPNQIFALSLAHPVLDREHWEAVVDAVHARLVTPVGLRSLAPGEADYKSRYFGDLHSRDAAYHQGTVWAWLIGPFIDAWLRVHPENPAAARHFLDGFELHLGDAGTGSISEVFDAEPPFTPRGCIAQAWSVAEVLRCLVKTAVVRE